MRRTRGRAGGRARSLPRATPRPARREELSGPPMDFDSLIGQLFGPGALGALLQVVLIDLVMSGDNAIIIGMAVAGLPRENRARIILWGVAGATLLRIGFAAVTTELLQIIGLTLAGGLLLLWVAYR